LNRPKTGVDPCCPPLFCATHKTFCIDARPLRFTGTSLFTDPPFPIVASWSPKINCVPLHTLERLGDHSPNHRRRRFSSQYGARPRGRHQPPPGTSLFSNTPPVAFRCRKQTNRLAGVSFGSLFFLPTNGLRNFRGQVRFFSPYKARPVMGSFGSDLYPSRVRFLLEILIPWVLFPVCLSCTNGQFEERRDSPSSLFPKLSPFLSCVGKLPLLHSGFWLLGGIFLPFG